MDDVAKVLASGERKLVAVIGPKEAVSKWIGETEKSIGRVFDSGERAGGVLVFDEADELFGKRTEHDGPVLLTARSLDAIPLDLREQLVAVRTLGAFDVAAESYDRFMGRFSIHLSAQLADLAGVREGQRVLDVGCGPGQLTGELVRRVGAENVAAVDPSEPFVTAARERNPGVDVQHALAEKLPFADDGFDAALAQLVVHFMSDPVGGIREMARVTRPGGVVAASVWDLDGGRAPLSPFWAAAKRLRPEAAGESGLPGAREGELAEFFREAGLREIETAELTSASTFETFDEWWGPYTLGVGPAGAYAASRSPDERERLREECARSLPEPPFTIEATAWAARGTA